MVTVLLVLAAVALAVTAGANDGGSILGAGLGVPGPRPVARIAILLVTLVVGPTLLFRTAVATTLSHGLVPLHDPGGRLVLLEASSSAIVVVLVLARAGLPTSLTLALVGAITGAGLGAGLPVHVWILVSIVAYGVGAPVVAAVVAYWLARLRLVAVAGGESTDRARRLHTAVFALQCLAYSANGGQKMLAVFAVAIGATSGGLVHDPPWLAVLTAVLFGVGILLGVRRISTRLGRDVLAVHLRHALVAEASSGLVVMAAGLAGVPLTMSQSVTGALVGVGASESPTRVRWPVALTIAGAWVVTLPASMGFAALAGATVRWL